MTFQRQKFWVPAPQKNLDTDNRDITLKSGEVGGTEDEGR